MTAPIWQVDAFADEPFRGNPAAVCVLPEPQAPTWMQHVAVEMNLSETAFLLPEDDGYLLRWFTPGCEVRLCGHATLASAHVLWSEGMADPSEAISFRTLHSGVLTARRHGGQIELDFPARPPVEAPEPAGLSEALGARSLFVGRDSEDVLALVDGEATVRELCPDIALLRRVDARGVIVTAPGSDHDFVSRFFAPAVGVDEDPVTGSAHCCLCPFWADRLGKSTLVGYQASPRGGVVTVTLAGDRVKLAGQAVTTLKGHLLV